MAKYTVGPSTVQLTGHAEATPLGAVVEHDFSITGPDGEHGPAREAALIAAGALTLITEEASGEQLFGRRRGVQPVNQEA